MDQAEKMLSIILAFMGLDFNSMSMSDKFAWLGTLAKFAESAEPLVKKYGGSVEEITSRYEAMRAEAALKDAIVKKVMTKMTEEEDNKA